MKNQIADNVIAENAAPTSLNTAPTNTSTTNINANISIAVAAPLKQSPTNFGVGGGSGNRYGSGNEDKAVSNNSSSSECMRNMSSNNAAAADAAAAAGVGVAETQFGEHIKHITRLFEKWNDCERTVVMCALLKHLRYSSLKFLQYSIDNSLTHNLDTQTNLSTLVVDINANNPSYLQNLLNVYKTFHLVDMVDGLCSSTTQTITTATTDKDASNNCYGSDFQLTQNDEQQQQRAKFYNKKEDILLELLNMLPLLRPGNEEAKQIYLALVPIVVHDAMQQVVPQIYLQQIFSYLLIHPALCSEDRRSLNNWRRHFEEHMQQRAYMRLVAGGSANLHAAAAATAEQPHKTMSSSGSSSSSSASSSSACSTASCSSLTSMGAAGMCIATGQALLSAHGGGGGGGTAYGVAAMSNSARNADWQTIAPPSKQQHMQKNLHDWSSILAKPAAGTNEQQQQQQLCDNLNGITLNELTATSQNSLGLSIASVGALGDSDTLVNGVVAAATSVSAVTPTLFGGNSNPIINIIAGAAGQHGSANLHAVDDHDNSFSKNGTEILDFEPSNSLLNLSSNNDNNSSSSLLSSNCLQQQQQIPMCYSAILMNNCDQLDINRWSLDSKLTALKTRRSNSLTTQTISSSSSSSNSSVITVNDNCSNSTENLAQFANKPRSFSLCIENQRGVLTQCGSDTRLDDFKPSYIKFHTRNVGMSSIGLWLKSLRLHKYIDLFKNMTYENMLQITEEYLQELGVTKGASHKLALCIEKLNERAHMLLKMERELVNGQLKVQLAVEELANIVLTPMKPIEAINVSSGEENVALLFLKVIDLACSIILKDPFATAGQDDESISVIMWILDRSIHNEAFVNHVNQLKDYKFKFSKLKMSIAPKMHHIKNTGNGNALSKPRWTGKTRKCDMKNGSNDRINHRKNSHDILNFSINCLQQQQQQQQQQQLDYEKYHNHSSANNSNQYKNSSYPNFANNQQPQQQQQQQIKQHNQQQHHHHVQQQQQQLQPQMLQQHAHFPALPQQQQHRRSLNNLIVISGGPQQPQKMIFKPGQGMLPATTTTSAENLQMEQQQKQQQQQQRKASLNSSNLAATSAQTFAAAVANASNNVNVAAAQQQQQQQQHQEQQVQPPKKTMAAVVMENLAKFDQHFTLF